MPVDLTTFVQSPDYMGLPPLSDHQFKYVEMASNIYRPETNRKVFDTVTADRMNRSQVNELCLLWGKGAGKNHSTTLSFARIAYLLLCLKDPARYFGKPSGDSIAMLNVAVNAKQAENTFFKPMLERVRKCPWFDGKYEDRAGEIRFKKNVTCYSGHSEREAWEGYNFIAVVLDEIAAFKTESEIANSNSDRVNSAKALYDMYAQSVDSRFPDAGKLILISFSRFKGDFISQRYESVVATKEVEKKQHTFKLHEDGPDDDPNNFFTIEWEEDHITSYNESSVYAHKAPSWVINPTMSIDKYKRAFWRDPVDSYTRFAGMPPDSIDAFFKDKARVEAAFAKARFPLDDNGRLADDFLPVPGVKYYMHVDLAERSDRAAVSMAHVSDWVKTGKGTPWETVNPIVTIDMVKWWTPKSDKNVEFSDVREFILAIRRRGFDLHVVTFDRWAGSIGLQKELKRASIDVETLSVQKDEYNNLSLLIAEGRLDGYNIPLLVDELLGLRVRPGGKVDHTRSGTNDLADATCGAAYLATKYEHYRGERTIDVHFLNEVVPDEAPNRAEEAEERNAIHIPPPIPSDLSDWLDSLKAI